MPYTKKDIEIINTEVIHQGFTTLEIIDLRFKMYNGQWSSIVKREVFKKRGAVGVLLFDPKADLLILSEQFRTGTLLDQTSPWQIEVIAGMIEHNETVGDTVHKEVLEEAAVKIIALEKITEYWASPGASNEYFHLFCAAVDSSNMPEFTGLKDEDEDIRLIKVLPKKAFSDIYSDEMNNGATIICLQWMKENYARLKDDWSRLI